MLLLVHALITTRLVAGVPPAAVGLLPPAVRHAPRADWTCPVGPVVGAPVAPGVGEPTRGDTVHLDVVDRFGNIVIGTGVAAEAEAVTAAEVAR